MTHSPDTRLDHWVETSLLRKARSKKTKVPGYSRYTNRALLLLVDLEIPFRLSRRPEDNKLLVQIGKESECADSWEDLAFITCALIYRVIEGTPWPTDSDSLNGQKTP